MDGRLLEPTNVWDNHCYSLMEIFPLKYRLSADAAKIVYKYK